MFLNRAMYTAFAILFLAGCDAAVEKEAPLSKDLPFYPMSTKSEEARQYVTEGETAAARGYFSQGYRAFKRAAAADSAYGYAYLRLAQSSNSLDEYRTNLARAVEYRATGNEIEQALIDHEKKLFDQDVEGAIGIVDALARKHPENARIWGYLSFIQSNNGKVAESKASMQKALELAPESGEAHLNVAQFHTFVAPIDLVRAETHAQKGLQLWPKEPISYDVLGDLRRAQARLEDAAVAYSKQIELNNAESEGYAQRGHVYSFLGKTEEARRDYDEAIRKGRDNSPAANARYRAYIPAYAGRPAESIRELQELVTAIDGMGIPGPEEQKFETLLSLEAIALLSDMPDIADTAYRQMSEIAAKMIMRVGTAEFRRATEGRLAMHAARIAVQRGRFAEAEQKLQEAERILAAERNPRNQFDANTVRGRIAHGQKRFEEALKLFERGDPSDIVNTFFRGQTLLAMTRTDEARAVFKQVANFNFNQPGYAAIRAESVRLAMAPAK